MYTFYTLFVSTSIGEFEQVVLLAILQLGDDAYAIGVRRLLERRVERSVTRGALYRTLDRLHEKGFVDWESQDPTPERGGHVKRRFKVSANGVEALSRSRSHLFKMWDGLESVLGEP